MAFVNEKMTPEEKNDCEKKLYSPGRPKVRPIDPDQWTIDRERNMFMISAGYNRENYFEKYFFFFWNDIPITIKIFIHVLPDKPHTVRWEIGENEDRKGDLGYIHTPLELVRNEKGEIDSTIRKEIRDSIKEAFMAYGVLGDCDVQKKDANKTTNIEFDF